jgi:hypothetical protein
MEGLRGPERIEKYYFQLDSSIYFQISVTATKWREVSFKHVSAIKRIPWPLVRKRTIQTERLPLVDEI